MTGVSRLDVGRLASGAVEMTPCGGCESPTRSHVLVDGGGGWSELTDPGILDRVPAETPVRFTVVCHGCFTDLDLPADTDEERTAVEETIATDAIVDGVVA